MKITTSLKMPFLIVLSLALVTSVALAAPNEAYKCTTAEGKISYLDTKPTTGCASIELVRINVGKGTSGIDPTADGDAKDQPGSEQDKAIAERKAQVKKECEAKKKNLETLKTKTFIQTKDADGKLHTLTPEEHEDSIKQTQDFISNMCG